MKFLSILFAFLFTIIQSPAQTITAGHLTRSNALKYKIGLGNTVHIISPEPISYVDISSAEVDGDIAEKKLCRIKPSKLKEGDQFTVTVVTKTFLSVYEFTCSSGNPAMEALIVNINPIEAVPIIEQGYLTQADFNGLAIRAMNKKREVYDLHSRAYELRIGVNNIFIVGDYLLFDIGIKNKSGLTLDVDQIKFTIKDEKILKATVSQQLPIEPLYRFYDDGNLQIKKHYRNIYCFKKFTFPSDKVLCIELTEKQISGRKILLNIDYKQVLTATIL
ncbi:conjugative transposon protein TraN [Niabella hirudinis]|uniref:conjugative transposon protein TraN n=1 Tax=Niabella hirudinis TaxID=1285929 RepID=UPI003EBE6B5C